MLARPRALPTLALIALLLGAIGAPIARANSSQYSVMMDDNQLLYRTDKTRDRAIKQMKLLGVDYVRATVLWSVVANKAKTGKANAKRFRRYGAADPRAYPRLNWNRYDGLVRTAQAYGIGVYFNVTGPGPSWTHGRAPRSQRKVADAWRPRPSEFKKFVTAVGRRYSGTFRDEDTGHSKLPRVSFWSLWNEPNQAAWLSPQWEHGKAVSPMLFRRLYFAGHRALEATGHGKDVILLGETAPIGKPDRSERSPMYPKRFLENLFCADASGARAHDSGCSDFTKYGPLLASAYAHHPYTKGSAPNKRDPSPLAFTMANISDLEGYLDAVATKTGRIAKGLPIALTEYGYETKPPDPYHGISLAKQAEYSNLADFMAWSDPRVFTQTQFLLRDAPPLNLPKRDHRRWFTYQSGLYFEGGRAKPAVAAYRFPFEAIPFKKAPDGGVYYGFWGQTRFRPDYARDDVLLQYRAEGTNRWKTFSTAKTGGHNYFLVAAEPPKGAGQVRAAWGGSDAPYIATSRVVTVK